MRGVHKRKPKNRHHADGVSSGFLTCELPPDPSTLSRGEIIDKYHEIKRNLAAVDKSPHFPNEASRQAIRNVLRARLAMIGIEKYQNASREGESLSGGFDSSQWVMQELGVYCNHFFQLDSPLSLLDVGAIAHRFPYEVQVTRGRSDGDDDANPITISMDVTSIDLNPEDSEAGRAVIKANFFDFAKRKLEEQSQKYHVISLSLCVNFEGCARHRGLMVHLASKLLHPGGVLFLVLPRACVLNSRYLNEDRFHSILRATDMEPMSTTYTAKLMRSVSKRKECAREVNTMEWDGLSKKEVVRNGKDRNNFAICLDSTMLEENKSDILRSSDEQSSQLPRANPGNGKQKKKKKNEKRTLNASGIRNQELTSNQRKKARRMAMKLKKNGADHNGQGKKA